MVNVNEEVGDLLTENENMNTTKIEPSSDISDTDIIDRYTELVNKKKEIEKEINELKVEVTRLSKLKNSEQLIGKNAALRVKITNSIKFPLAKDPQRKILEEILKENGKWIDVSVLNTMKLSAQFKSDNWDADLKEKISQFSHDEESVRISIVKI